MMTMNDNGGECRLPGMTSVSLAGRYVEGRRDEWRRRWSNLVDRRPEPLICHGCDWNDISGGGAQQQQVPDKRHLPAWMAMRARMIDRCAAARRSLIGS